MSSRKLGGRRVLGNGSELTPASAEYPRRSSSLLSPSASSISVTSSASTSQPSTDPQDLSSHVSFEHSDENNAASIAPSPRLACPICNDEMVRLTFKATAFTD